MPERSARELLEEYTRALDAQELDRLPEFLHPDVVYEYPQSGERIRGIANVRAVFENYPGGIKTGSVDLERARVIGDDATWMMTPTFTVLRVAGAGSTHTMVIRQTYPDGSRWYIIAITEVRDGKIAKSTSYFAPEFEAPAWRAPFVERSEG